MEVKWSEFIISNSKVADCPNHLLPEYAFIGRSNVGKSSLINSLTQRKKLAKTSSKPGKTQLVNHFLINKKWYLVDLPGYGYAKASKKDKHIFQKLIHNYFEKRSLLTGAFILLDIRHQPQKIDLDFIQYLGELGIPFALIFTKSDKLKPSVIEKNISIYKNELQKSWEELPIIFVTSAVKGTGRNEILSFLDAQNKVIHSLQKDIKPS